MKGNSETVDEVEEEAIASVPAFASRSTEVRSSAQFMFEEVEGGEEGATAIRVISFLPFYVSSRLYTSKSTFRQLK
jgi:hypothetical protein